MANNSNQTADLFGSYPQMKKDETKEEIAERFKTPYDATLKDVKSVAEFTPIVGDAIALSQLPENAQEAFSLLKGGFETRDVIRLGKGAGLAALAALDLTAVGDVAKPLIKKAKDALRSTADALSPQAVTDIGIPVDIDASDPNTNVTLPKKQEKERALEMQVRATGTTERYKGAVNDYSILSDKLSNELETLKIKDTFSKSPYHPKYGKVIGLSSKKTLDFLDYNLGDTSKAAQAKYFDKGDDLPEDLGKNVILEDFIIQRAYQNMPEEKRLAFLKKYPDRDVPREKIVKYLSVEDIEDFNKRKIYQQTGVYRGRDGQLKTEISTGDAKSKNYLDGTIDFDYDPTAAFNYIKSKNKEVTVKDILDFPSLYNNKRYGNTMQYARSSSDRRNYLDAERDAKLKGEPILSGFSRYQPIQDIKVEMVDLGKEAAALYYPMEDKIVLSTSLTNSTEFRASLLHELQHAVQNREGFDFGASFREFLPSKYADVDADDIPIDEYNKALAKRNRVAGEYEADLVEWRDAGFGPYAGPDIRGSKATFPFDSGPPVKDKDIIRRPLNIYPKEMNKGGVTMKKQMNLFNEGGLEQDGGTVDPVSGNDVPVGSSQEEVRDDIPAQLSEGEFVFPADVVRFIGLEKLMAMRQKAKEGLSKMEAMGQMGNSEEATLPDDVPFDETDIVAEDDDGNEVEMAKGGVLMAQQGTVVPKKITTGFAQEQFVDPKTGETVSVYNVNGMYIPFDPRKRGFVKKGTEVAPQEPVQQQVQQPQPQPQQEDKDDRSEYDAGVEITLGYEIDPETKKQIPQKYTVKKDLLTGEVLIANEKMDKEAGFSSPQWIQLDDTLSQKLGFTAEEGGASKDDLMMTASFGSKGGPMGAGMATLSGKGDELNAEKADAQAKIKEFNALRANENLSDIYGQHLQNQQQKKEDFKFSDVFKRKEKPEVKPEVKPVYNTATVANEMQQTANTNVQTDNVVQEDNDNKVSVDASFDPLTSGKRDTFDDKGYFTGMNKGGIATKPKKKKTKKQGGLASKK